MSTAVVEEKKTGTELNQLEQLKKFTKVVADTADFESIKQFKPQDATTNPSLVYAATQKQQYAHLIEEVLADRKKSGLSGHEQIEDICDHLLVKFGCDILEIVPGRVSTETDARLSFDVEGSGSDVELTSSPDGSASLSDTGTCAPNETGVAFGSSLAEAPQAVTPNKSAAETAQSRRTSPA